MVDNTASNLFEIFSRYRSFLIIGTFGILLLIVGIRVLPKVKSDKSTFEFIASDATSSAEQVQSIKVEIAGKIINPGVYSLKDDSRVQDLLIISGGLSAGADRIWVSKNVNLAAKLTDGGKIYIPAEAEVLSNTIGQIGVGGDLGKKLTNINTASQVEIEALPGVGTVTAGKMISSRPYGNIDELLNKKIVNKSIYEKIKDMVSVN